jgi:hypothetical protein
MQTRRETPIRITTIKKENDDDDDFERESEFAEQQ